MSNLVYINSGVSSVFDSQVLALLKYYQSEALFDKIHQNVSRNKI